MTRIKYTKDTENKRLVVSTKPILCNNRFVNVIINLDTLQWKIIDAESKKTLLSGVNNTLTKIKKDVKLATIKLGATYYDQVRGRRFILK